jgi:hypothetical protein
MITVVGGTYREICLNPRWNHLRGSGVRAAAAISKLIATIPDDIVELKTWASGEDLPELDKFRKACDFPVKILSRPQTIEWQYDHSLSTPRLFPAQQKIVRAPDVSLRCENSNALVFGTIECNPRVTAPEITYDPQAGSNAIPFSRTGHCARKSALVANFQEILAMADGLKLRYAKGPGAKVTAARALLKHEKLDVVVVKSGTHGAEVVTSDGHQHIPSYPTQTVFPIGSGDVFSAVFALHWSEMKISPFVAADWASVGTAVYCKSNGRVPLPTDLLSEKQALLDDAQRYQPSRPRRGPPQVYLAGPLFTLPQLWFLEETTRYLEHWGAKVFSPWRDVGLLADIKDRKKIATEDLKGLNQSHSVFAIIDGCDAGTLFEIGYAVARRIPVVAFGQKVPKPDLTMLLGTGCEVQSDFATAVYRAAWLAGAK